MGSKRRAASHSEWTGCSFLLLTELGTAFSRTELYEPFDKIEAVKGREIILWSLSPADQLYASVLLQKKLRGLELSIIIVSHGVAMRSRVMDCLLYTSRCV